MRVVWLAGELTEMSIAGTAGGRIAPGVGANLIGQHAQDRNQDATVYVGNLDPQVKRKAWLQDSKRILYEHHCRKISQLFGHYFTGQIAGWKSGQFVPGRTSVKGVGMLPWKFRRANLRNLVLNLLDWLESDSIWPQRVNASSTSWHMDFFLFE